MSEACSACGGCRWVCESHPDKAWPGGCACGPGMPCTCNPSALLGPGSIVIAMSESYRKKSREAVS